MNLNLHLVHQPSQIYKLFGDFSQPKPKNVLISESTLPECSTWPKISIVTPSFNQSQYLEETILSVISQEYPNLEYIIIDGGSTDGSVEIIKKYEPWLSYWVSEPDRGQSHAINKGFGHSTGEIMAWINSDDYYEKGAFQVVAKTFLASSTGWVAGNCFVLEENGRIRKGKGKPKPVKESWMVTCHYAQPAVFWRRNLWNACRGLDETLHYSLDYELWLQFAQIQPFAYWIDQHLAYFRLHDQSKTMNSEISFIEENRIIHERYYASLISGYKSKMKLWEIRITKFIRKYWILFFTYLPLIISRQITKSLNKILFPVLQKRHKNK